MYKIKIPGPQLRNSVEVEIGILFKGWIKICFHRLHNAFGTDGFTWTGLGLLIIILDGLPDMEWLAQYWMLGKLDFYGFTVSPGFGNAVLQDADLAF